MRILMLGWEFPPFISGGLGTACYGLTRGLDRLGAEILFVLPKPVEATHATHVQLIAPGRPTPTMERRQAIGKSFGSAEFRHVKFRAVDADLAPYMDHDADPADVAATLGTTQRGAARLGIAPGTAPTTERRKAPAGAQTGPGGDYAGNLFDEIERYRDLVDELCVEETFDVVHAHDWMTFRAGIRAADLTGKPLVVHVHSTEFDRSGLHVDQRIYDIEREGMHRATRVVAVSFLTKNIILKHYGVDARKVDVVYNAIDENGPSTGAALPPIGKDEKIVLFLGRITQQKGPEFFLMAAKRVLEVIPNTRFIMAGSGDMIKKMIDMAQQMGIGDRVLFTGFLRGDDVKRVYRMADLYVMPSVSEPFGIAPLEALANDVPVLISKQSGVAEVIQNALKVDFWDVDEMANKIVAVLRHPPLQATLRQHGSIEVRRLSWTDSAESCMDVYRKALASR
ncbi:MAG: glycosyltransferase [Phycisphaerae bacterium]|nr:glycosyltransferase [Phycisphaerae bacterium]